MKSPKFISSTLPIALAGLFLQLAPSANAEEIKGVEVPSQIVAGEDTLTLNGTAVRTKWGFGVYVVGLYLAEPSEDEKVIMQGDSFPKRVHMTMLREVPAKKFHSTIQENIDCNFNAAEKEQYRSQINSFLACFPDDLVIGKSDVVNIDFIPGQGTLVAIQGRDETIIPGDDFYHAILRLWIGKPLQESVKPGLLGKAS